MSFVAGVMYVYGAALVGAGALGLDEGVPTAAPPPLVPLSVLMGGAMVLAGALATPRGAEAPKRGEPGFAQCVPLAAPRGNAAEHGQQAACLRALTHANGTARGRRYMAAVHIGLLLPLAFAGAPRRARWQRCCVGTFVVCRTMRRAASR
jgi:hypothetical protein